MRPEIKDVPDETQAVRDEPNLLREKGKAAKAEALEQRETADLEAQKKEARKRQPEHHDEPKAEKKDKRSSGKPKPHCAAEEHKPKKRRAEGASLPDPEVPDAAPSSSKPLETPAREQEVAEETELRQAKKEKAKLGKLRTELEDDRKDERGHGQKEPSAASERRKQKAMLAFEKLKDLKRRVQEQMLVPEHFKAMSWTATTLEANTCSIGVVLYAESFYVSKAKVPEKLAAYFKAGLQLILGGALACSLF